MIKALTEQKIIIETSIIDDTHVADESFLDIDR